MIQSNSKGMDLSDGNGDQVKEMKKMKQLTLFDFNSKTSKLDASITNENKENAKLINDVIVCEDDENKANRKTKKLSTKSLDRISTVESSVKDTIDKDDKE